MSLTEPKPWVLDEILWQMWQDSVLSKTVVTSNRKKTPAEKLETVRSDAKMKRRPLNLSLSMYLCLPCLKPKTTTEYNLITANIGWCWFCFVFCFFPWVTIWPSSFVKLQAFELKKLHPDNESDVMSEMHRYTIIEHECSFLNEFWF